MADMKELRRKAALQPLPDDPADPQAMLGDDIAQGYGETAPAPANAARPRKPASRPGKSAAKSGGKIMTVRTQLPLDTYMEAKRLSIEEDTTISKLICSIVEAELRTLRRIK